MVEAGRLDAIEVPPSDVPGMPTVMQAWFDEALPGAVSSDSTENDLAGGRFPDAGQRFRRSALLWQFASTGQPGTETDDDEQFVARADIPGARGRIPAAVAFTYHGLAIAHAAFGRPGEAHRAWARARELFAEFDHHCLIALTLLHESRDVALTYAAAEPATRRRLAAEAEAALGRAGGALRPGISPRLAWLGCLVLDGRWQEALQILDHLPAPGNPYLRRETTGSFATLARLRGEPADAWAQLRPLFPEGPATEPGDGIHQEGLFLQRLAADLCLDAGDLPGARAWLAAHDPWLAWSGSVLGRADGHLAWARYHRAAGDAEQARARATRRWRWPQRRISRWSAWPRTASSAKWRPRRRARSRRNTPGDSPRPGRRMRGAIRAGVDIARAGGATPHPATPAEAAALADASADLEFSARPGAGPRGRPSRSPPTATIPDKPYRSTQRELDVLRLLRGALQPGDRRRALHQPRHRADPRRQHLPQAGGEPRASGRLARRQNSGCSPAPPSP